MQIQLPPEIERAILAAAKVGDYDRVADQLADAVRKNGSVVIPSAALSQSVERLSSMPDHVDVDEVADKQGVGPVTDFRLLKADFWPQDETSEQFLAAIHSVRRDDAPRVH